MVAPFWHPIKLAGEAAMTDVASDGRLDLGIARGAYVFEYERLVPGLDAWAAGQRMREIVPAIKESLEGRLRASGRVLVVPEDDVLAEAGQRPHPPIWIAARDPNSHDFAVANGCNVQVTPLASGDGEVAEPDGPVQRGVAAHPEVPRPKIMLLMHTFVADGPAETAALAEDCRKFYCQFGAWFQNKRPVPKPSWSRSRRKSGKPCRNTRPTRSRENLVIGEADAVIARLKAYEALGYDQYSIWIDSGMPTPARRSRCSCSSTR